MRRHIKTKRQRKRNRERKKAGYECFLGRVGGDRYTIERSGNRPRGLMAPRSLINQMFGLLRHCHEASILSTLECEVKERALAVTAAGQIRNDHSPFREYSIHTAATRQLSNDGPRLPALQFILCLPPQPHLLLVTLHLSLIDCIGRAAAFSPLQINKQPGRRVRPVAKKPDKDSARLALT